MIDRDEYEKAQLHGCNTDFENCDFVGFDIDGDIVLRDDKGSICLTKQDVIKLAALFGIHIKMMEKQIAGFLGGIVSVDANEWVKAKINSMKPEDEKGPGIG